ncbi:MAG: hypothetical protein F6K30_00870 [Cyanothece sp. SIO2G6]|nr:hypothetical protein [Cyanothece sp. SIO2G6]
MVAVVMNVAASTSKPIAILGMGCRFPAAATLPQLWQSLCQGEDGISVMSPKRREQVSYDQLVGEGIAEVALDRGAFLDGVDLFDPGFFGLAEEEAQQMDPQQRLLLEVAWEALENAGLAPDRLATQSASVFIGATNFDYSRLLYKDSANLNIHSAHCTNTAILANRISYVLGIHGISATVDAACSSSVVALHQACISLIRHESNLAIVGGVNLTLDPVHSLSLARSGLLSATGSCKVFDADADGYVRGEGCGVVILKRLDDAIRDDDPIQAVICGSAVSHNGVSNGLTAPNGPAQQMVVQQALDRAGVKLSQLGYVEVSAVGSQLGDAIEVGSLKAILRQEQEANRKEPLAQTKCWLSSAKPNLGNLEAASGMAALIKTVLVLQHQQIPPQVHFNKLNPYIKLDGTPFQIATTVESWDQDDKAVSGQQAQYPRLAGINSFGFGGTNAHVILAEPPDRFKQAAFPSDAIPNRSHHLLTLSARTESALGELALRYQQQLESCPDQSLGDICFTTNEGRSHFPLRAAVVVSSKTELQERLQEIVQNQQQGLSFSEWAGEIWASHVTRKRPPKVVFALEALRSDTIPVDLGKELYEGHPEFRAALAECDRLLQQRWQLSVLGTLYPRLHPISGDQPSTSLRSTTINQLVHFALQYATAKLWQAWDVQAAAVLSQENSRPLAALFAGVVDLETALQLLVWGAEGFPENWGDTVGLKAATCPVFDVAAGGNLAETMTQVDFWQTPIEATDATTDIWERLKQKKYGVCLSLGLLAPNPDRISKSESSKDLVRIGSTANGQLDWRSLFTALAQLYTQGVKILWPQVHTGWGFRKVSLPTYSWQHQSYWFEQRSMPSGGKTQSDSDVPQPGDKVSGNGAFAAYPSLPDPDLRLQRMMEPANGARPDILNQLEPNCARSQQRCDRLIHWLQDYSANHINSRLIDERRCIPPYVVLDFGNQGVLGMQVPQKYGGINLSHVDTFRVFEQLGAIDVTLGAFVGVHHVLGTRPIMRWAQPQLRDELLPGIAQGRELAAFAITEPGAGSNPRAIATTATATGSGTWQVNGEKIWIGSGSWASVTNVFVQTVDGQQRPQGITGFAVRRGTPGFRQGPEALTMGMRGMVQNSIHFDNAPVTADGLLGNVGEGLTVAQDAMMFGRLGLGVLALGGIKRCTQLMLRYSSRRSVSTGRLLDNPVTLTRLGHLTAAATAVESLTYTVARLIDNGYTVPEEFYSASKVSGPEFYWQATDQLIQLLGGRGYIESNAAPQMLRDARLLRIFEGPTETLTMFMGSRVLQSGENLYQFLTDTLGVAHIAQRLQDAVQQVSDRILSRDPFGVTHSNSRWAYSCAGELTTWAILLAMVQVQWGAIQGRGDQRQQQRLQRAATWAALQFDQKLQQTLAGSPEERVVQQAGAIASEIEEYTATIGMVEQTLAGEDHDLDEWLEPAMAVTQNGHSSNGAGKSMLVDFSSMSPEISVSQIQQPGLKPNSKLAETFSQPGVRDLANSDSTNGDSSANSGSTNSGAQGWSGEAIADWIEQWLRGQSGIDADTIDPKTAFADYGMDSVMAVELVQDLEDWLSLPLDATLLWNFSNIDTLSQYLAKEVGETVPKEAVTTRSGSNGATQNSALMTSELESSAAVVVDAESTGVDTMPASIAAELMQLEALLEDY